MIRADQIPDEVVEAAVKAFDESEEDAYVSHAHDIRAAIAAALNAWPGAELDPYPQGTGKKAVVKWYLDLPLPQENSDE